MAIRANILLFALLLAAPSASARDLPKSDPERTAILDAARGTDKVKFVVKDLFRGGDFAYLCALKSEGGNILGTDDALDVYQWVLIKDGGKWHPLDAGGGFAPDTKRVGCDIGHAGVPEARRQIKTPEDINAAMAAILQWQIRGDLDHGKVEPGNLALFQLLARRKVIGDFSIEHEKEALDRVQLRVSQDQCKEPACKTEAEKAFTAVNARSKDPKLSALVWQNCRYGIRASNLTSVHRCVAAAAPLPHCRPNLKLQADRKDIEKCLADIHTLCDREYPGQKFICN
jgi:hypothetical protein